MAERSVLDAQRAVGNHAVTAALGPAQATVQRRPEPSGAAPVAEAVLPTVSVARTLLERAEELACGTPHDLASAEVILRGLADWLHRDANAGARARAFRSLGMAKTTAMTVTGRSVDAVTSLRRKLALARRYDAARPMRRSTWRYHRMEFDVGAEFLEVLTGERTLEQTAAPAIEQGGWTTVEMAIGAIPVVGALVAVGEAIVGRDLSGRKLTGTERALIGGLGVFSEIGLIARGARAATTAARLRILSRAKVAMLRNLSRAQALVLVAGARALTAAERTWLKQFARILRAGQQLTAKQIVKAHRLLAKMNEGAMVSAALRRNASRLAGATGVVLDVAGATLSAAERRIAEVLRTHFGASRILALAEQGGIAGDVRGVSTADFVVERTLVEAYSPTSAKLSKIMNEIGAKHTQAGVIAVDLTATSVDTASVRAQLGRLWADPNRIDISRIIVVEGTTVTADVTRPAALTPTDALTAAGAAGRSTGQGAGGARRGRR